MANVNMTFGYSRTRQVCFLNWRNPSVHRHAPSRHPLLATRIEHCSSFTQSLPRSCAAKKRWWVQVFVCFSSSFFFRVTNECGMSIFERIVNILQTLYWQRHFLSGQVMQGILNRGTYMASMSSRWTWRRTVNTRRCCQANSNFLWCGRSSPCHGDSWFPALQLVLAVVLSLSKLTESGKKKKGI